MNKKIFYLHIPKTAGSSMNRFLTSQFEEHESLTHIESVIDFSQDEDIKRAKKYTLLSGHVPLPHMQQKLNVLNERVTLVTLRNPIEHVISHIAWVRKLGDESEESRLKQHNATVQKIVKKLLELELSKADDVKKLICWLEKEKIYLFHDTQIKYIGGGGGVIQSHIVNSALVNLKRITYVGISERLGEFQAMLCDALSWKIENDAIKQENKNDSYYGLNIQDEEIRKALQPLIQWDILIYREARQRFVFDMHSFLSKLEMKKGPRYSSVREPLVMNEYKEKI